MVKKDPDEAEKLLVMSVTNIIYNSKKWEATQRLSIWEWLHKMHIILRSYKKLESILCSVMENL